MRAHPLKIGQDYFEVHLSFSDISNIPEVHFMDQGNDISIPGQQTEVALGNALPPNMR